MNIHLLHGFLGSGKDFDFIKEEFPEAHCTAPSLFAKPSPWRCSLRDFGREYNALLSVKETEPTILIGYSLGGRLGLHALIEDETRYRAAVIVSAHIGLESVSDRSLRLQNDQALAKRLKETPFREFLEEWDRLPLFKGSPEMQREEADFEMDSLQHALASWSLGSQKYLREEIEALSIPLLFVAGEDDVLYRDQALSLRFRNPKSQVWIAQETTHRVPWQSKEKFVEVVRQFIKGLTYDSSIRNVARDKSISGYQI